MLERGAEITTRRLIYNYLHKLKKNVLLSCLRILFEKCLEEMDEKIFFFKLKIKLYEKNEKPYIFLRRLIFTYYLSL